MKTHLERKKLKTGLRFHYYLQHMKGAFLSELISLLLIHQYNQCLKVAFFFHLYFCSPDFQESLLPVHPSDVLDMPVDPNEPTYCLCHQVSYGEMIGCDNPDVHLSYYYLTIICFLLFSCYLLFYKSLETFRSSCRFQRVPIKSKYFSQIQDNIPMNTNAIYSTVEFVILIGQKMLIDFL